MERFCQTPGRKEDQTKDDWRKRKRRWMSQKTGCSSDSQSAHSSSFMLLWIFGGLNIDWQPPNSLWKVLEIKGIILFLSGIYRQQQSNLIPLHPSVTLIRTRTDAGCSGLAFEPLVKVESFPSRVATGWCGFGAAAPGWKCATFVQSSCLIPPDGSDTEPAAKHSTSKKGMIYCWAIMQTSRRRRLPAGRNLRVSLRHSNFSVGPQKWIFNVPRWRITSTWHFSFLPGTF